MHSCTAETPARARQGAFRMSVTDATASIILGGGWPGRPLGTAGPWLHDCAPTKRSASGADSPLGLFCGIESFMASADFLVSLVLPSPFIYRSSL
jgi:hypothetical protein